MQIRHKKRKKKQEKDGLASQGTNTLTNRVFIQIHTAVFPHLGDAKFKKLRRVIFFKALRIMWSRDIFQRKNIGLQERSSNAQHPTG